jgi:hypothetical protein
MNRTAIAITPAIPNITQMEDGPKKLFASLGKLRGV